MRLLLSYLRHYRGLVALALVLATINQVFSLLDPLIFRHVIDEYATRYSEYTTGEFVRGVGLLLGAAVGVAFVSRVAKNFQDYVVNAMLIIAVMNRSTSERTFCSFPSVSPLRWSSNTW